MIALPNTNTQLSAFAQDVNLGLNSQPKYLLSKYFYDSEGDHLFQKIMDLPEYYLTRCEEEILRTHAAELTCFLGNQAFDLVELGVGDGLKTRILLAKFQELDRDYRYFPVDISRNILDHLQETLHQTWPRLSVLPLEGDYFSALEKMPVGETPTPKLVLFLGSTIGNMSLADAEKFMRQLRAQLEPGDLILVGFDLKKNPELILAAYNDAAKVTRDFNLNHLHRINRELGGNFKPETFQHWPVYHPVSGHTKSYLISTIAQTVFIEALNLEVPFAAWEAIDMELSKKYDFSEIEHLATLAGLQVLTYFKDQNNYFTDALFVVE